MQETDETMELHGPPRFGCGDKVRACHAVRNDGTFRGRVRGEVLIETGDAGYVVGIGSFLQRYYIYDVDFVGRGYRVGMRAHELALVAAAPDDAPGGGLR